MNELLIVTIVILILLILVIIFVYAKQNKDNLVMQQKTAQDLTKFKEQIGNEISQFEYQMVQSIKNDLNNLNENTSNKMSNLTSMFDRQLMENMKTTNEAFNALMVQLSQVKQTQNSIDEASKSLLSLKQVLLDKKTRGNYGEIQLYSLLELTFGENDRRFIKQAKLSNGNIVDALLITQSTMGDIPIDSKFPLENYNRLCDETISKKESEFYARSFHNDVVKHLNDIATKYVSDPSTADFAYLFVPAEAIFAYIYGHDEQIINLSYQLKVYIVSPTTLMAYITAIQAIMLGHKRDEQTALMQKEYSKLAIEFERFAQRWQMVSNDYEKNYHDMKSLEITVGKIQQKLEQITNAKISD